MRAPDHHDVSPPLRDIPPAPRQPGPPHEAREPGRLPPPWQSNAPDPVTQTWKGSLAIASTGHDFEGIGDGFTGPQGTFTINAAPPDTNGDVGPNHYVQIVNTDFAIFDRTGTVLHGPVPNNTLWSGFGGGCQTNNDGDAVVKYDKRADRWIFSQFSVSTTPYRECLAISKTGDPAGQYDRYSYTFTNFPDYPKLAVWPDAYYVTYNMFNGNSFAGGELCAYDRATMLAGGAATEQCFAADSNMGGSLPSDVDGPSDPPAGSPNYVLNFGTSSLQIWQAHIDWGNPGSSTLTGPTTLSTAAFSAACGGGTCVPQPGTTTQLDSLADRLMYRLGYRNFGDHESLVVNHSVTPSGSGVGASGVRWYEIRSPGSSSAIFQQGTYAPADGGSRWMGSIGMDGSGDIAMGYSVSSGAIFPSVRYTGRLVGDPLGTMPQGEASIQAGTGSQTKGSGGALHRWGDYSSISVDPVDDCTFWYTNEYLATDGIFNWHTRIGSFRLPSCGNCSAFPAAVASGSATICAGQSTALSGSGGVSCSWSPSAGLSTASSCAPSASPTSTTSYTLTVTDANGCSSTNDPTVTVTVNAKPTPAITPSGATTFCQGGSVMLDAGAGYSSYLWSPGGVTTQKITVTATGSYSVTVTNANGCSGTSSSLSVTAHPLPTAVATGSATICAGQSTALSGSGGVSCSWSPSTGLSNASSCNPTASPASTTTYTLAVTDANGCHSTNAPTATVTVITCTVLPQALAVDPTANGSSSDGNGVFEPGEIVSIQPAWENPGSSPLAVTGTASNFTGSASASYTVSDASANYGTISAGQTASCGAGGSNCYLLALSTPAIRPAHWDATFLEALSTGDTKTWTLHIGDSFSDIPRSNVFYRYVETIFHNGITQGGGANCSAGQYCPSEDTRRDQMTAFVARSLVNGIDSSIPVSGSGYDCSDITNPSDTRFSDTPPGSVFCRHANLLSVDGIVFGCGGGKLCAGDPVSRGEMAIMIARALQFHAGHTVDPDSFVPTSGTDGSGRSYNCATGPGPFADAPAGSVFCRYVGDLWVRHIVDGLPPDGSNYGPLLSIRRDESSKLLANAFVNLPLYGPGFGL